MNFRLWKKRPKKKLIVETHNNLVSPEQARKWRFNLRKKTKKIAEI